VADGIEAVVAMHSSDLLLNIGKAHIADLGMLGSRDLGRQPNDSIFGEVTGWHQI